MKIKQDPVTGLWCREDGVILMPPGGKFKTFRWTFGSLNVHGYLQVQYKGRHYRVHRLICRAFHGLPPIDKPETDHIDRDPSNNKADNLRWSDRSLNSTNRSYVDASIEKYGVRYCDDKKAYDKAHYAANREEKKAYQKAYTETHREERRAYRKAYDAAKYAKKRAARERHES